MDSIKAFSAVSCILILTLMLKVHTFNSESAGEMWNLKVQKIAHEHLFPISGMDCSDKILIFSFFCINQIISFKTCTNIYVPYARHHRPLLI